VSLADFELRASRALADLQQALAEETACLAITSSAMSRGHTESAAVCRRELRAAMVRTDAASKAWRDVVGEVAK
jgi:hypothetical protein